MNISPHPSQKRQSPQKILVSLSHLFLRSFLLIPTIFLPFHANQPASSSRLINDFFPGERSPPLELR